MVAEYKVSVRFQLVSLATVNEEKLLETLETLLYGQLKEFANQRMEVAVSYPVVELIRTPKDADGSA